MIAIDLSEFIAVQYGDNPTGYVSLWSKQTKRSTFFPLPTDTKKLVSTIERRARDEDLYLMLGLQKQALQGSKRGGTASVIAVPGLFADVDFSSAKDSSKRYPTDEAHALRILSDFPFQPTWIINTGGGLHVHWLFPELLRTETVESLAYAKKLSARFQRALQTHYRKHGAEIDSVGDLARNHRIPGSLNHKTEPPRAVRLVDWQPTQRVPPSEVQSWLDAEGPDTSSKAKRGREPSLLHHVIQKECAWYRHTTGDGAATCDEPDWYAAASITALCKEGESVFHTYSAQHPTYSEAEAAEKLARARAESGPRTCENIEGALGFSGCAVCPHRGKIKSPAQLGRRLEYDPGEIGPVPLGYTRNGLFVLLDRGMSVLIQASAQQLLSAQFLQGLAPIAFWSSQFPPNGRARFDFTAAGESLIAACRRGGAFVSSRVRGRGIWREGAKIVVNLDGLAPRDTKHLYLCFEPIDLQQEGTVDAARLLELLRLFKWRNPHDATLLMGWLAIAPICGVLNWRPHCFVYGPSRSGKTTLHSLAAHLLTPLVISADGGSTEAGIRQTLGPDSLPIIIDEFESDQHAGRITQIIRLARSASSAENPVLRGTPEGKAMQFSLRTSFFFSGINPRGMSAADDSRILQLELLMHANRSEVADRIRAEENHFKELGPIWCSTMANRASLVPPSIDVFLAGLPGMDRRHRQNMATLFAGAFVALFGRIPNVDEAKEWASDFASTVELHAQPLERDDAVECLQKLLSYEVERYPLAHWLAVALAGDGYENERVLDDAKRIVRTYDFLLYRGNEHEGLLIRNGSPAIERVFAQTQWGERAWMKALKKLQGATTPEDPIHFPNAGKSRCTCIPFSYIPEPYEVRETWGDQAERISKGRY